MTPSELESKIVDWARRQSDVKALIQIGSRVQPDQKFDDFSDWDFHLVTSDPGRYRSPDWVSAIARPWCAHTERSSRGNQKTSAVFEGGLEADFIPLSAWQMELVYGGMKRPWLASLMPRRLLGGILEIRVILLNSGHRVLVGGQSWEDRLSALRVEWPWPRMEARAFDNHVSGFWQKAVWVAKKVARPEVRSAMHWMHKLIIEHVYALLEEEAWVAGRRARPEALKAERWLDERRLLQTSLITGTDQLILARALLAQIELFEEVSASVAGARGFTLKDHSSVAAWLRGLLQPLARGN